MVCEIDFSDNEEALIVLAGTVAGAAATFVASLPTAGKNLFLKIEIYELKQFQAGIGLR